MNIREWNEFLNRLKNNDVTLIHAALLHIQIDDSKAKDLGEALKLNHTLVGLEIKYGNVSDKGLKEICNALKENTCLKHLKLGKNQFGEEGVKDLTTLFEENRNLETLDLTCNNLGNGGIKIISNALRKNLRLIELNLSENQINEEGAKDLAAAIDVNPHLKTLNLSYNKLGNGGIKAISNALRKNTSLTQLNLKETQTSDEGAKDLAGALKVNTSLEHLMLGSFEGANKIGDVGAINFADALKLNRTLITLNLEHNLIGDMGIKAIGTALRQNCSLVVLDCEENKFRADIAKGISEQLNYNYKLQLHDAVRTQNLEKLKFLLNRWKTQKAYFLLGSVEEEENTALHWAVQQGSVEMIQLLVSTARQAGVALKEEFPGTVKADDVLMSLLGSRNKAGLTPLDLAQNNLGLTKALHSAFEQAKSSAGMTWQNQLLEKIKTKDPVGVSSCINGLSDEQMIEPIDRCTIVKGTALHAAAQFGNGEMVKLILARLDKRVMSLFGADAKSKSPLYQAARYNRDASVTQTLLEALGTEAVMVITRETILEQACEYNANPEVISALFKVMDKHVVDTMKSKLFSIALKYNENVKVASFLLQFLESEEPDVIQKLITEVESESDCTLLDTAALHNSNPEIWKLMLNFLGKQVVDLVGCIKGNHTSVLMAVSKFQNAAVMSVLLESLGDQAANLLAVADRETGYTPLHVVALERGKADCAVVIIKALDKHAVEVAMRQVADSAGKRQTALHFAVYSGQLKTVVELVRRGADVHAKNEEGKSVLQLAKEIGQTEILTFLQHFKKPTPNIIATRNNYVMIRVRQFKAEQPAPLTTASFWQFFGYGGDNSHVAISIHANNKVLTSYWPQEESWLNSSEKTTEFVDNVVVFYSLDFTKMIAQFNFIAQQAPWFVNGHKGILMGNNINSSYASYVYEILDIGGIFYHLLFANARSNYPTADVVKKLVESAKEEESVLFPETKTFLDGKLKELAKSLLEASAESQQAFDQCLRQHDDVCATFMAKPWNKQMASLVTNIQANLKKHATRKLLSLVQSIQEKDSNVVNEIILPQINGLVEKGADLSECNGQGYNALHCAILAKGFLITRKLLEAFPNQVNSKINYTSLSTDNAVSSENVLSPMPMTPLDLAMMVKEESIIELLKEKGGLMLAGEDKQIPKAGLA